MYMRRIAVYLPQRNPDLKSGTLSSWIKYMEIISMLQKNVTAYGEPTLSFPDVLNI